MSLDRIMISRRAISSQYKDGEFFRHLPKLFDYLLSKHDDDGFSGCENVRLAITDSFDRDTRALLAKESAVIFDLSVSHDCDEIIKAFTRDNSSELATFDDYILSSIEKHLYDIEAYQHALWLHACRNSLYFDYKHNHRLRCNILPKIPKPADRDFVEVKLQALILAHEIRHHLIENDVRARKINGMLRTWIEIVQYESFSDLDEDQFIAVVDNSAEELVCDYAAVRYWDDIDWDLRISSKTPATDFCIAMFSLALHLEITARLKFNAGDIQFLSHRLRSAVLRRSAFAIAGEKLDRAMIPKYECLYERAVQIICGIMEIRKFEPPSEITEFSRPDLALEYFNAYDRDSEEWSALIETDMKIWYDKVFAHHRLNDDIEFNLMDKICKDALSQPWLAHIVELLFERQVPDIGE